MMYFTHIIGWLMFIHFGCAILKHESSESDFFLKVSLLAKIIFAVLIIRASFLENVEDLLFALIGNAAVNMVLALYIWAHGITFIDIGKHMHKIKASELVANIKKTL